MYEEFAYIYDFMMEDVDYPRWTDYIESIFNHYGLKPKKIVDLACGTGNITLLLAKRGYDVIGVDASEDMLVMAQDKALELGLRVPFIWQDMRNVDLHKGVDVMLIMCDGVNYILEDDDLRRVFSGAYTTLNTGGILVFDISSYYKLSTILGDNLMADNDEDIALIWQNFFDKDERILIMDLSFFVRKDIMYQRFDETHIQRAYTPEEIELILRQEGFRDIEYFEHLTFSKPKADSERILFSARKI